MQVVSTGVQVINSETTTHILGVRKEEYMDGL